MEGQYIDGQYVEQIEHSNMEYDDNMEEEEKSLVDDNDEDYVDCDIDELEEDEFIEDSKEITLHDLYQ